MKRAMALILTLFMLAGLCGCGDYVSLMPGSELEPGEEDGFCVRSCVSAARLGRLYELVLR